MCYSVSLCEVLCEGKIALICIRLRAVCCVRHQSTRKEQRSARLHAAWNGLNWVAWLAVCVCTRSTLWRNKMMCDILSCTFRGYISAISCLRKCQTDAEKDLILNSRHLFIFAYDYFRSRFWCCVLFFSLLCSFPVQFTYTYGVKNIRNIHQRVFIITARHAVYINVTLCSPRRKR